MAHINQYIRLKSLQNSIFSLRKNPKVHFFEFSSEFQADILVYMCQIFIQVIILPSKGIWTTLGPYTVIQELKLGEIRKLEAFLI